MSGTSLVLVVIGVIVVLLGLLQHFAKVGILGVSHGSLILVVIGVIVVIAGVLLGQSRRRPVV